MLRLIFYNDIIISKMTMYKIPSSKELDSFLKQYNLNNHQAAKLLNVSDRTIRKWTSDISSPSFKVIPWSTWILLRLIVGDVSIEKVREELNENMNSF